MKKLLIILTLCCCSVLVNAQGISATKVKCADSLIEVDILFNSDNSYYSVGAKFEFTSGNEVDAYLAKYSSNHTLLWFKKIGGSRSDRFREIRRMKNGHLLLAGTTESNDGDIPYGYDTTAACMWAVVADTLGNILHGNVWGYGNGSLYHGLTLTDDDKVILTGETIASLGDFSGNTSAWLTGVGFIIMADSALNKKWVKVFNCKYAANVFGPYVIDGYNFCVPMSIIDTGGDYAVPKILGTSDAIYYYLDTNGTVYKKQRKGGYDHENHSGNVIYANGVSIGVVGSGCSGPPCDTLSPLFINEYPNIPSAVGSYASLHASDTNGNILWRHIFGSFGPNTTANIGFGEAHMVRSKDKIWIASDLYGSDIGWIGPSFGEYDIWVLQFDTLGILQGKLRLGGNCYEALFFIKVDASDNVYIGIDSWLCSNNTINNLTAGCTPKIDNRSNTMIYKLGLWPSAIAGPTAASPSPMVLYPNPANNTIKVTFSNAQHAIVRLVVMDMNGRVLNTQTTQLDNCVLETAGYANGQYLLQLIQGDDFSSRIFTVTH